MRRAFFSKSPEARRAWAEAHIPQGAVVLHLHPKNLRLEWSRPGVVSVPYEDITKTSVWLRIASLLGPETFLVFENPSRYPKITSEKVKFLRRLSQRFRGPRIILDIVPFTLSIEYLYTPYSLLDRAILGYAHWYAFRENYQEVGPDGVVVNSLDFPVLARKAAAATEIDYRAFLAPRETISFQETDDELRRYAEKRATLFETMIVERTGEASPQKIITRLADHIHRYESRQRCLLDLAGQLEGDTVVFTNLLGYAKDAQRALRNAGHRHCRVSSYQLGASDLASARHVIYLESPIVNSFYLLDIEAALSPDCRVHHLCGTAKVDRYLYGEISRETQQIDGFTRALWEATRESA